jgi:ferric-dicitrate binding protein FerR (iron transport regulator)
MTCEHEEKLSALLDGELPPPDLAALEEHASSCATCGPALEAIRAESSDLDAAFAPLRARAEAVVPAVLAALPVTARPVARPRWPLVASLASAAAGFAVAALLFRQAPLPEKHLAPVVATLTAATGALEVNDSDVWRPLASGGSIGEGDWVRTVGVATAAFECKDGSEVRLNAGTECQLASRTVHLKRGEIYTKVAPDPARRFAVTTLSGKIEALGTTLDIAHAEATRLTVVEGKALVGGQTIEEGFTCSISGGIPTNPTRAEKLATVLAWVGELAAIHRAEDADFDRRINQILETIGQTKAEHLRETDIRAMGERCALPLARYLESPRSLENGEARHVAARVLADVAPTLLLADLLRLLEDDDSYVRVESARALERITGNAHGTTRETWMGASYREAARSWRADLDDPRSPWCSGGAK